MVNSLLIVSHVWSSCRYPDVKYTAASSLKFSLWKRPQCGLVSEKLLQSAEHLRMKRPGRITDQSRADGQEPGANASAEANFPSKCAHALPCAGPPVSDRTRAAPNHPSARRSGNGPSANIEGGTGSFVRQLLSTIFPVGVRDVLKASRPRQLYRKTEDGFQTIDCPMRSCIGAKTNTCCSVRRAAAVRSSSRVPRSRTTSSSA